jgi:hypothetical protein
MIKLKNFTNDEIKSFIKEGIEKYNNSTYPNNLFKIPYISAMFEVIKHIGFRNPTKREQNRLNLIYKEIVNI